jgi:hypothetical protein
MKHNLLKRIAVTGSILMLAISWAVFSPPVQTHAASALVDSTLERIFLSQICPALQNIPGQKLASNCQNYRYQKDLDKAEGKVCAKYGANKLKSQCKAYATAKVHAPNPTAPNTPPTSPCNASGCDLIGKYVNPLINVLSVIFGLIAVISIILGGIQYSTSEGDPQKASQAKNRIAGTIMAIFAYALLYGFLQFLIPGGLFH